MPNKLGKLSKRKSPMADLAGIDPYMGEQSLLSPEYLAYLGQNAAQYVPNGQQAVEALGRYRSGREAARNAVTMPYDAYQNPTGMVGSPEVDFEKNYSLGAPSTVNPFARSNGLDIGLVTKPRKDKKRS